METSIPIQVQPEAPQHPQDIPIVAGLTFLDQEEREQQDHENEDEMRRRLDEWRSMAANLTHGFTQMPDEVRNDPTLGISAKVVYEHLLWYMRKKDWCWPSQQRIATEVGISRRTVIRACKELHERCYIEKWRRGLCLTNYYFVNPLTFVSSFKRPDRGVDEQGNRQRVIANSPSHHAHVSTTEKPDVTLAYKVAVMRQNSTSRSDTVAQPEASKSHSKHTKANHTHLNNINKDSDSSGEAASFKKEEFDTSAPTCSHIARGTIRNEETILNSDTSSTSRNSKPSSVSLEAGGAERAEAAKVSITEEKLSKWQALALAHGVSLTQQDALDSYVRNCSRPTHIPMRVEESIDPVSRKFNNVQYLTSNRTQAAKLWQYARLRGMNHEYLHDMFQVWVDAAAAAATPPYIKNKMAWFFKALHLEILKALLPYESEAPIAEEQPNDDSETDNTFAQEEQETMMPEEEAINQEHDASSSSDEQECQEQPALEPEYLMTEDSEAGWTTWASANHWADRLHEWVKDDYSVDVLPTRFGRWGFYLYEQGKPEEVWQYMEASMVIARIEEVKQQRLTLRTSF